MSWRFVLIMFGLATGNPGVLLLCILVALLSMGL
jgi:hypothetical protein